MQSNRKEGIKKDGIKNICLIGFGEVGSTLAKDLLSEKNSNELKLSCFDTAFRTPNSKASANRKEITQVTAMDSPETAVANADLVISVVTAEQAINAAKSVCDFIGKNTWYWDLNSVSPKTKQDIAAALAGKGKYVEGAIMSPIHPKRISAPILLGGPNARAFVETAKNIGFTGCEFFSAEIGKSAASKMCRSVIIKGIESLLTESLVSARYYGVEDQVIASLNNLLPGIDWQEHSAYMISRSLEHGVRRAEEMREVHKTVKDAGLVGLMSEACAETQSWTAGFGEQVSALAKTDSLPTLLDEFRAELAARNSCK